MLGEFLKGTLERAGVLRKGELITDDMLDAYGRQAVTLEKIEEEALSFGFEGRGNEFSGTCSNIFSSTSY